MNGTTAYALSKQYVSDIADSLGSLKGAPCTIKSITEVDGGQKVTFEWTGTSGTKQTSEMTVKNGVSVTGISDKGNGVFTLLLSDGSESDPIQCVKGEDGFSPTATVEKVGKVATITITDKNGTTTATIKDGEGSEGGEANVIDSISVNGVNVPVDENKNVDITVPSIDGLAKTEDIPTKVSELTNDSGYLTEHQDISGKVDKVDGKSLIANTEIERLASVDNYDDTQIKTQIQAVANGLMDSVGYSADYKTIDIIAKNGVKKSVNVAPIISHASITELSDVDTTNKATGKALVYNATTNKHEYADVSGTDEKVKMDSSTDAKYLGELLDNITIANENGALKVKKLDGQEVTITEINYLKGLTMNVMDLVNMFSNGGVKIINTPVATYAELLTLDKSSFIDGISYLVYVLADENHDNAKTTYLVDKDSETPTYFGFADSQRDFTTNPIDLATEITGKLGITNMDSDAIKALFTVDDTYKTETATNNAFSTHGAKALYDELLLAIGNKANSSDLTAHKDDADIHVSTEDRTKWDSAKTHADSAHAPSNAQENILETVKVNGTALEVSDKAVNVTVPTKVSELTDSADYAKKTDIPTTLPADGGNADTVNNHTVETDVPTDAKFTDTVYDDTEVKESIENLNSNLDQLAYGENAGGNNLLKLDNNSTSIEYVIEPNVSYVLSAKLTENLYRVLGYKDGKHIANIALDSNLGGFNINSSTYSDIDTIFIERVSGNIGLLDAELFLRYEDNNGDYHQYIPSVKMLTEENEQQNTEAIDLKMLGWTVPSECPVQNYVDGNGVFHQRVGRVDLGSLKFEYDANVFFTKISQKNIYCYLYKFVDDTRVVDNTTAGNYLENMTFTYRHGTIDRIYFKNTSYTDVTTFKNAMKGVYLYYELATEQTISVDGNEAVTKVNDSLEVLGKCKNLLNATLQTTTIDGVTCTNNGDGTYTLNGTPPTGSGFSIFELSHGTQKNIYGGCLFTGTPLPANEYRLYVGYYNEEGEWRDEKFVGDKGIIIDGSYPRISINLLCNKGASPANNLVFKPMITTNLSATYDDFVPYTGDGETLTHDVAEIKNDLGGLTFSASGTTLTITDGTNTWTLGANS